MVVKPCHIGTDLFCPVIQGTKQRYDYERQIVNNVTLVNVEYLKNKEMQGNLPPSTKKSLWPFSGSTIFLSRPFRSFHLKFLMSETGSAGFIFNDHVTHIHSSYLTDPTETKTFSELIKKGCKSETNIQTSKIEVLVGHCLRETQVVGIQEAESYLMAQRLRYWGWGVSYLQNRCLANFDFDIDASKSFRYPLTTRCHQLRIHSL